MADLMTCMCDFGLWYYVRFLKDQASSTRHLRYVKRYVTVASNFKMVACLVLSVMAFYIFFIQRTVLTVQHWSVCSND